MGGSHGVCYLRLRSIRADTRSCPDEGCIRGLPPVDMVWENPKKWSEVIGAAALLTALPDVLPPLLL